MNTKRFLILKILAAVLIILSVFQLCRITIAKHNTATSFDCLRSQISEPPATRDEIADNTETKAEKDSKIDSLQRLNPECVGWLKIDGTDIDYPVMLSLDDPEFYLDHDFDGNSSAYGVPFIDASGTEQSDNVTVYGHSMRDGSMFAQLERFTVPSFCKDKHSISFRTINGEKIYEAVSVFKISEKDVSSFPYHLYHDFSSESMLASDYIARSKYYAIWYDNTAKINDTDKFLTLSTCEYTLDNGRLVVVARAIT